MKAAYLPLMPSFCLGPGADAMNQYLALAISEQDHETVDLLMGMGAVPDEESITDAVQAGSEKILKILCTSSDSIKEKVVTKIQSSGKPELLEDLALNKHTGLSASASSQSMFIKPMEEPSTNQAESKSKNNAPR